MPENSLRSIYKLDDFPAEGRFAEMVESLESMSLEAKRRDLISHLQNHIAAIRFDKEALSHRLTQQQAAAALRQAESALDDAMDIDAADELAVFQLEIRYFALANELNDQLESNTPLYKNT